VKEESPYRYLGLVAGFGFSLVGTTLIGLALGLYLDGRYGTSPRYTLLLLILGIIMGGYNGYKMIEPLLRRKKSGPNK